MTSEKFLHYSLLICITLLSVHFRTGVGSDGGDFNILAFSLRAVLWFGVFFLIVMLLNPKLFFVKPSLTSINRTTVIYSWPLFMCLTLISTIVSGFVFDEGVSALDAREGVEVIGCFALILVIYNLLIRDPHLVKGILVVLLYLPAVQMLGVIFISPEFAEVLGVNSDFDFIWYFGYGNRFIGLLGNANAVAFQCCIALPILTNLLISRHVRPKSTRAFVKAILAIYGCVIIAMILLTGVRAALFSILIMLFVFVFYLPLRQRLQFLAFGVIVGITGVVVGIDIGVFDVIWERLGQNDGRIFIWRYYIEVLTLNPLGYGLTFENIIDITSIQNMGKYTVRLTPHNALLEVGVYSGWLGMTLMIMCLVAILQLVLSVLRRPFFGLNLWYKSACVAWVGLVVNSMFGGLLFGSWFFSILTAIILAAEKVSKEKRVV